jgi:hypothetical protein
LGQNSPIGRLFYLGRFLKVTEVANIFEPLFPTVKVLNLFCPQNGFGHILGYLFTNSSGHPACPLLIT